MEDDMTDLAPLMLKTGETKALTTKAWSALSSAGAGEVMYTFDTGMYDHRRCSMGRI